MLRSSSTFIFLFVLSIFTGVHASPREFVLTEDHIRLIRCMHFIWMPVESGAPVCYAPAPYGVQSEQTLRSLFPGKTKSETQSLHKEATTALSIILTTASLHPGEYSLSYIPDSNDVDLILPGDCGSVTSAQARKSIKFTLTMAHLRLLPWVNARWYDGSDHPFQGCTGVDVKHPYDESGAECTFIAWMASLPVSGKDERGRPVCTAEDRRRFEKLHKDMLYVVRLVAQYGKIAPGTYRSNHPKKGWQLLKSLP